MYPVFIPLACSIYFPPSVFLPVLVLYSMLQLFINHPDCTGSYLPPSDVCSFSLFLTNLHLIYLLLRHDFQVSLCVCRPVYQTWSVRGTACPLVLLPWCSMEPVRPPLPRRPPQRSRKSHHRTSDSSISLQLVGNWPEGHGPPGGAHLEPRWLTGQESI